MIRQRSQGRSVKEIDGWAMPLLSVGPFLFQAVASGKLKVENLYYQGKLKSVYELNELMRS
jgi:hypothetical protein